MTDVKPAVIKVDVVKYVIDHAHVLIATLGESYSTTITSQDGENTTCTFDVATHITVSGQTMSGILPVLRQAVDKLVKEAPACPLSKSIIEAGGKYTIDVTLHESLPYTTAEDADGSDGMLPDLEDNGKTIAEIFSE